MSTVDHRSSPASAFRDCIRSERGVVSVSPEEVRRVLASKLARGRRR